MGEARTDAFHLKGARVLLTGATGFLGRHVTRRLQKEGAVVFPVSRRLGFDLRDRGEVYRALLVSKPDAVIHIAALVGGIGANMDRPADFFRDNLLMGLHVIEASSQNRVRLTLLGTLCSYPREAKLPIAEEEFWSGYPEPTNASYGIAKKSLLVYAQAVRAQYGLDFSYLVPANMYGPEDNFDPRNSHVIPALIRKFCEAKAKSVHEVECWGTGRATRSFLYAPDAAEAVVRAAAGLDHPEPINLAGGQEIAVSDLAALIAGTVGYEGSIFFDRTQPDGQPRRAVSGTRAKELLGWEPSTPLDVGLRETIEWYLGATGIPAAPAGQTAEI